MNSRSTPTVSVVMSIYNAERWLEEALDSVLAQSFSDFEFLLVDDGSTDGTARIIARYAARDDRCRVITKHNTGLSDSLNVGIERARGEWIARLDADDIAVPTRFEEQLTYLRKNPGVVLLGTGFDEI